MSNEASAVRVYLKAGVLQKFLRPWGKEEDIFGDTEDYDRQLDDEGNKSKKKVR